MRYKWFKNHPEPKRNGRRLTCVRLTSPQLHGVLWVGGASCLYTLTSTSLSKWEVDDSSEHQVLSWDVQRALSESIADAIWVSVTTRALRFSRVGSVRVGVGGPSHG